MISIETYYLIDFENVNSDGLCGCEKLTGNDHVIIFFTKNAMKINMADIADHGDSDLKMTEIPAGKQSADMHIGSYVGYLTGANIGCDYRIVIISKDTDFDNIIQFWNKKYGNKTARRSQIKPSGAGAGPKEKNKTAAIPPQKAENEKTLRNNIVMQVLSKAGYSNEVIAHVASTVAKNTDIKNGKQQIYRTIISKYGQAEGLKIYNQIKKQI